MNNYERPEVDIISFETEDVITTSWDLGEEGLETTDMIH